MSKNILIDANAKFANYIAINNNEITRVFCKEINQDLTQWLVESFKWFIYASKNNLKELDTIYFVNGPGSFTNIRLSNVLVKTICTLNKNIKIKELDRLSFYKDKNLKQIIIMTSSRIQKFIYIHNKSEVILKTTLISNEEFEAYKKQFKDYLILDITNEHFNEEFKDISKLNLDLFKEIDVVDLKANYLKEPNIDMKVKEK